MVGEEEVTGRPRLTCVGAVAAAAVAFFVLVFAIVRINVYAVPRCFVKNEEGG